MPWQGGGYCGAVKASPSKYVTSDESCVAIQRR
jgi:hypothetical protein